MTARWTDADLEAAFKEGADAADRDARGYRGGDGLWHHSETRKMIERARREARRVKP